MTLSCSHKQLLTCQPDTFQNALRIVTLCHDAREDCCSVLRYCPCPCLKVHTTAGTIDSHFDIVWLPTLTPLPMNFLDSTFLDWKVMLEPIAARKPGQLKVTSVTDAIATPPTIGNSVRTTGSVGESPKNKAESTTLKNGSKACRSKTWR